MIYEADSDGNCQVANLMAANSERERRGKWSALLGTLEPPQPEGEGQCRRLVCQGTVASRSFLGNGGQCLMEWVTFLLHYCKEQTQRTFMSAGANELNM